MGIEGEIPPLQVGGVQDAVTAAAPMAEAVTVPTLPNTVLVAPDTLTLAGLLELQVTGTSVRGMPRMSVTVALRVVETPVSTRKEVDGLSRALIEIVWTGQLLNCNGWLLAPLALAKNKLVPGEFAVALC
jgi:hypothetical protein